MTNTEHAAHFHRMARTSPRYRWWRPMLVGLIAAGLYVVFLLALSVVIGVIAVVSSPASGDEDLEAGPLGSLFADGGELPDMSDPTTAAFLLFSVVLMLPAVMLAMRLVGARPTGSLSSVTGQLRWGWLGRCLGFAAVSYAVGTALSIGLSVLQGEQSRVSIDASTVGWMMVVVVLLVPLQATAEEYVFRGYLMQMIGGWIRHPAFAILLPVPLFVLGHDYGPLGMLDVGLFAVIAGWITWRTGGLEAAIALHVVNNCVILALGAVGLADPNATDSTISGLVVTTVTSVLFCVIVTRAADSGNVQRTAPVRRAPLTELCERATA
ncbi:CPBP family intramembrane glutamic endopeptidase [Cryobacterium sp. Y57]|uniref:CPBP family intramembrane glutamic endopeptidase n=1 Tax=Cryobacterium sp. Y57 TaxID=2048287 RepID=UPI000CE36220|nr:type II CAAX endopeptidase family protein [Cryobacterium sp. Y57]